MKEFFNLFKISIVVTIAIALVAKILYWRSDFTMDEQLEFVALNFVFAFVLTLVNAYYNNFISTKFSWETQAKSGYGSERSDQ